MRHITTLALFALPLFAQAQDLSVTGDAEIQVTPDRVRLSLGVENRDKLLAQARLRNDSDVKTVLAAVRAIGVDSSDIQTDFMKVDMHYQNGDGTTVDYYIVENTIAVTLKNVARFEDLLNAVLDAGRITYMTSISPPLSCVNTGTKPAPWRPKQLWRRLAISPPQPV